MKWQRRYLKYLLIPSPWLIGAIFFLVSAHKYNEVSSRERTTSGIIVNHEPQNHNRFGYQFRVDGREYSGSETPLAAEPKIGQSVTVYYDPFNPAENSLTDFSERSGRALAIGITVLILSAVAVAVALIFISRYGEVQPNAVWSRRF